MISLRKVTKVYGEGKATQVRALRDVDLEIEAG